ncbi:uncharacterized protein LOC143289692 [Babylonia areolata]|uniref:uncharacterized protein LOC143289692 n=1 Tax=Babylonia areolata TaxID=304850 RepID=UPI003FD29987
MTLTKTCIQIRFNETDPLPWDNPDNIVTQDIAALAMRIKNIVLAVSFLVGGPANVINMAVFYKQGIQDRVNLCLFMLALFDGVYLTSALLIYAENIYLQLSGQVMRSPANEFMTNNHLNVFLGSGFVSCVLSAIIACERCYCVLRPLKYQTLLRTRTMAVIIAAITVCVFVLFFLVYQYRIVCVYDPVPDAEFMMVTGVEFYKAHKQLIDLVESVVFGAGIPGGMMVVVIATTTVTTTKLRRITAWRSETSTSLSPKEVALTKMLIGSSVFFILCTSPACTFRVACLFMPEMRPGGRHYNFYFTTLRVLVGFYFVNSSFNIFIYYVMGSRYRATFWTLFNRKAK